MTIPRSDQSVHLMTWWDVRREVKKLRREEGRNTAELEFYTTDDLRQLYQSESGGRVRLRDGIINRSQLAAVIRWRVWWERFWYRALLGISVVGTVAALAGAVFAFLAWRFPLAPPK